MARNKTPKPEPVATNVICSLCDEPWSHHELDANGEASMLECIRLLKAKRHTPIWWGQPNQTYPYSLLGGTEVSLTLGNVSTTN